jgi:hypothetical protein
MDARRILRLVFLITVFYSIADACCAGLRVAPGGCLPGAPLAGAEVRSPPTMTTFKRAGKAKAKDGEGQGSLSEQPGPGQSPAADGAAADA